MRRAERPVEIHRKLVCPQQVIDRSPDLFLRVSGQAGCRATQRDSVELSASELVDRAHDLGLVTRHRDADDSRRVRLRLTDHGIDVLNRLTEVHLGELSHLAELLDRLPTVVTVP